VAGLPAGRSRVVHYQHALLAAHPNPTLLGRFEDLAADLPSFLSQPPTASLISPVAIDTVAVWDTVGSLGIPEFTSTGVVADLFRFANTTLGPDVAAGIHGVSRDEMRADFTPTLGPGPQDHSTPLLGCPPRCRWRLSDDQRRKWAFGPYPRVDDRTTCSARCPVRRHANFQTNARPLRVRAPALACAAIQSPSHTQTDFSPDVA
jgi:hypothetical protein